MATLYLKSTATVWSAASSWSLISSISVDNLGPPVAGDDCVADAGSGSVTIDTGAVCRSLNCTGYTATMTHTAAVTLTIGDATAGTGSVALKLVAGMTYTLGSATTSALSFISTSATVQTVTSGTKTLGNVTFNAASNGSWAITDNTTLGTTTTMNLTKGTLRTDGTGDISALTHNWGLFDTSNSNVRALRLGVSTINITGTLASTAWNCTTSTNLTLTAGTSQINVLVTGSGFHGGSKTYYGLTMNGGSVTTIAVAGANTFTNLSFIGVAVRSELFFISANNTITGALTVTGQSILNRALICSNGQGTARVLTITGATVTASNADFRDITLSVSTDLSAISGGSGDWGGNSGITFTTAATQTWSGTSGGNWSANAWTTRVPLAQDNVVIASAFSAAQTIEVDVRVMGKSVSFSGTTGSPALSFGTTPSIMFGSFTFSGGTTISVQTFSVTLGGRGSFTLTNAGVVWKQVLVITAIGGTYSLQDALTLSPNNLSVSGGTFTTNGFSITALGLISNGSLTRTLNMGATVMTFSNVVTMSNTGMTYNAGTSKIFFGSIAGTFIGAGLTYYDVTILPGTVALTFTGANVFNILDFGSSIRTITMPAATTTTAAKFICAGGVSNIVTLVSSTPTSAWTLSVASGIVSCDYISLTDSTATGGATFYAGSHSTNVSNNTGWSFTDAPHIQNARTMELMGVG